MKLLSRIYWYFAPRTSGQVVLHVQIPPPLSGSEFYPVGNYNALSLLRLYLGARLTAHKFLVDPQGQKGELNCGECLFAVNDAMGAVREITAAIEPLGFAEFCHIAVRMRLEETWQIVFPANSTQSPAAWFNPQEVARERSRLRERRARCEKEFGQTP